MKFLQKNRSESGVFAKKWLALISHNSVENFEVRVDDFYVVQLLFVGPIDLKETNSQLIKS